MVDLHTHSKASDGGLSPSELVHFAAKSGVSVLALTDHDTVAGLQEASAAAAQTGTTFIPGIELGIEWTSGEFHLLGLGIRRVSEELEKCIQCLQAGRNARNRFIIEKMNKDGLPVSWEEVSALAGTGCLGRPHFAEYLVQKKIVRNRQQAFDKFLGKGRPYYAERKNVRLSEAVCAVRNSGAVPVLAHPLSLYVSWGKMESVLSSLKEAGISGIEAWHPGARVGDCMRLETLGQKLGLFITAGSDFHGEHIRSDRKIGYTAGGKKIEDRFWTDNLKQFVSV
ncbi:MAG: PHP domain-containing protein [Bacteroides sp.]|nr:PHP domain-containing protein [Prevotella sp.]MCM1408796.1 PHP domain-containing protein [Treponema brennaborense]MCM1470576.1 PHP domain-containing protein [Bacteroides sp.]